ncbi:unnamed protein product [Rotaria sp. Silwood1]|nr:unnamed protein product [Rotaria sp. Silwood1]CAF3758835.1 unnamed protein product [Rotaria sp. Silwood1]CAF3801371.1 unnamed protein product [Rotaria sp. Silwood1]CAF4860860.1 unnamed protein product [Rotaria sp. Silwood1]CAF4973307.1 unnamed protein product [Rotaria sp. Silwood1]
MEHGNILDGVLKLLNGLNNDPIKRVNIIEYVQMRCAIAVFAYGSLIWNPFDCVKEIIPDCTLTGYTKGFFCQDFIYRGTRDSTGLTMGLKPCKNAFVKGYLLMSDADEIVSFIEAFIKRETPTDVNGIMDIYTYDFLPVLMPNGHTVEWALTCVVNCSSQFYINTVLSIEQQAEIIGLSYGINGTNFQYLHNTLNIYRTLALCDTFTEEMEQLYAAVLLYRQKLTKQDRHWLDMFDQLSTKIERQLAIQLRETKNIRQISRKLFSRMYSVEPTTIPKYQRMLSV